MAATNGITSSSATVSRRTDPGIVRLQHLIVNSYLVGEPGLGQWVLVDAGLSSCSARKIIRTAAARFGEDSKPSAIVLTHGHFDHVGAVKYLAKHWNVPVYAHDLEIPYLTGRSAYPPPDPTVGGGLMARMSKLYPRRPIDMRVQPLPPDGVVPGLPGWRWIHTPGHSPGHVSLFRFSDRAIIAGDAFVTVKQESLFAVATQWRQVHGPPAYFTPDWAAARHSIEVLNALEPELAVTGHGLPMAGERLRTQLRSLVLHFEDRVKPARGRYVSQPAVANDTGVVFVPPPIPDPFPKRFAVGAAAIGVVALLMSLRRSRPRLASTRAEGLRRSRTPLARAGYGQLAHAQSRASQ